MKRSSTTLALFSSLIAVACGTVRPLTAADAPQLNALFQQRVNTDSELRADVLRVDAVAPNGRDGLATVVVINGKTWSDKSRTQQERLVKKIGAHMQDALYAAQPNLPRSVFLVRLQNDIREEFGFIMVGGSNDQGVVYNAQR